MAPFWACPGAEMGAAEDSPRKVGKCRGGFLLHAWEKINDVLRLGCVGPAARDEDMLRCFRGGLLLDSA